MPQWLTNVQSEAEKTNNLLLRGLFTFNLSIVRFHLAIFLEFCQQLSGTALFLHPHSSSVCFSDPRLGYLSHGTSVHYGR